MKFVIILNKLLKRISILQAKIVFTYHSEINNVVKKDRMKFYYESKDKLCL